MIGHQDLRRFIYETGSPFKRLEALLKDVRPNPALEPMTLTIGEPRHAPPTGIAEALNSQLATFGKYPATTGTPDHRQAIADWIMRRYQISTDVMDPSSHVLPLSGSREGLVLAARCAADMLQKSPGAGQRPLIIMQNPFYQSYAVGALVANCDVLLLPEGDLRGQSVSQTDWKRTVAAYIASPLNPQGSTLTHADWHAWIDQARLHDFYVFADECYSEIYRNTPPPGILEVAARTAGRLRKVISFNSLSKRSNLPGLRTGFVAGDETFIAAFTKLRLMGGPQVPIPLQHVAAHAWSDEAHVEASRALYAQKWGLVDSVLGPHLSEPTPPAGFFLWLKLPGGMNDVEAALMLWKTQAIKTIPGSYISHPFPDDTVGADRLRIALIDDEAKTRAALARLQTLFQTDANPAISTAPNASGTR